MRAISCRLVSDDLTFTINVVVHVLILFTFLTMFFIFFVSKLTKEMFEKEISHLIGDNVGDLFDKLDEETKQNMKLFTKTIPLDKLVKKFEEPSEYVLEHNRWVNLSALAISIVGVVVLGLVLYILYNTCGQCVPLRHILMENAIIFACVGVVEYLFFTRIALKFVPAPPSLLVSSLINRFKSSIIENT